MVSELIRRFLYSGKTFSSLATLFRVFRFGIKSNFLPIEMSGGMTQTVEQLSLPDGHIRKARVQSPPSSAELV